MHNVFVNQLRSRRPVTEPIVDDLPAVPVAGRQGQMLELLDVERALHRLPAEQREVLLLIALEQMSYDEVSRALEIPIGTVMSRLSRGRERMRALVEGTVDAGTALKVVK